ncbi:MAG: class I SAM-dependent methyltransferase [bacterium]
MNPEIESFQKLWNGGYMEGDPLDPLGHSGYGGFGYLSSLHATYLRCIKPYVRPDTVALELGPGRGTWTRSMLKAREIWCLDALPESHNRFYEHIGPAPHVNYVHVEDFECTALPEQHFTYMFSYGCLCHVSFDGIRQYAINLHSKLRPDAECFWMVADYRKYNAAMEDAAKLNIYVRAFPNRSILRPIRKIVGAFAARKARQLIKPLDEKPAPSPGRWFDAGIERTCEMLEKTGYRIVDADTGVNVRDPVIHFVRR